MRVKVEERKKRKMIPIASVVPSHSEIASLEMERERKHHLELTLLSLQKQEKSLLSKLAQNTTMQSLVVTELNNM